MIGIYIIFKFYLSNYKNLLSFIENAFITLSLIISTHILYSFLLFNLGYESSNLWLIRDTTYYPYTGTSSINFKSLFMDYNQVAHVIAPGFLFLLNKFNNKFISVIFIIFYLIIFNLIRSKFLIIFFGVVGIYLIVKYLSLHNKKLVKSFLCTSIIGLGLLYFLITHFLIIEKEMINNYNLDLFKHYYFTDFVISLGNYDIFGSLFLKLKFTVFEVAKSFNYIIFDSLNYFNHEIVLKNFESYTDPHSDYFGSFANYGIIGFFIFLGFPIYIVSEYLKNINIKKSYNDSIIYFLIIILIFIEAIIVDFFHTQFVWIIFAMYKFNLSQQADKV